jgi:hypothetical protein
MLRRWNAKTQIPVEWKFQLKREIPKKIKRARRLGNLITANNWLFDVLEKEKWRVGGQEQRTKCYLYSFLLNIFSIEINRWSEKYWIQILEDYQTTEIKTGQNQEQLQKTIRKHIRK